MILFASVTPSPLLYPTTTLWHRPCARDLQSNVTLLMLVTLLGTSQADGHIIRSNVTCLITLLLQGTLLDTSDVT